MYNKFLGSLCLSIGLLTTPVKAQVIAENDLGFHVAASAYTDFEPYIPVRAYFGTNIELGVDWTHYYQRDKFWKTGISYTFYKSPFKNGMSYYDEYIQIPFVFSIAKCREFKHNTDLYMTFGPQVSIQTRQGRAQRNDRYYNFDESHFGGAIKFGLTGEFALYQTMVNYAHSGGLRLSTDIPKLLIRTRDNWMVYDQYITATLFYSISKRRRPRNRSTY